MVDATPAHAWLVAQTRRRLATALLGLNHPQAHPGMALTI